DRVWKLALPGPIGHVFPSERDERGRWSVHGSCLDAQGEEWSVRGVAQESSFNQYLTGGAFPKSTLARARSWDRTSPRATNGPPRAGRRAPLAARAETEGVADDGDDSLETERLDEHQIHPALAEPHGIYETAPAGDDHHR